MTADSKVPAASPFGDPPRDINTKDVSEQKRHADATLIRTHAQCMQARLVDTVQDTPHPLLGVLHALPPLPGLTHRDSAVVYHLVLLRLLAHGQLKELAFPHQDGSVLRRRAARLESTGWVTRWDAAKQRGGLERYLHRLRRHSLQRSSSSLPGFRPSRGRRSSGSCDQKSGVHLRSSLERGRSGSRINVK
jgi:hypothetical protein